MSKIILLTVFMLFVLTEIKSLFKSNTVDIIEEAKKTNKSPEEYKGILIATSIILFIIGSIFDIWATVTLNIPILYIGAAICILLNVRGLLKLIKQLAENKIKNKFSIRKIYHLVFDSTVLYFLVRMVFQYW